MRLSRTVDVDTAGASSGVVVGAILGNEVDQTVTGGEAVTHERKRRPVLLVLRRKESADVVKITESRPGEFDGRVMRSGRHRFLLDAATSSVDAGPGPDT